MLYKNYVSSTIDISISFLEKLNSAEENIPIPEATVSYFIQLNRSWNVAKLKDP